MGSSGQLWDGITQESDLVVFVFSVELNGRCGKSEFERNKTRTKKKTPKKKNPLKNQLVQPFVKQYSIAIRMCISLD